MNPCTAIICACFVWAPVVGSAADLTNARPYTVVAEMRLPASHQGRGWYIVSDADIQDEFLETAMNAARDLHRKYGSEYTTVRLLPNAQFVPDPSCATPGPFYATIDYSARGRGARALGPRQEGSKWRWRAVVSARPLTPHEFRVAELWCAHQNRFPQTNMLSSCSYDHGALVEFIANELGVSLAEAELVQLPLTLIEPWE